MPLRKIEYDSIDALNDALKDFPYNENTKFITVSLQPSLYKESFQNQYVETAFQLKQFIECVATDSIIVIEGTKKSNVHYHILANSEHSPEAIDDFVRNFKKLGNTFTKKCNDKPIAQSEEDYLTENVDPHRGIRNYMIKDFTRTEELLNGLYVGSYIAPAFRYTYYEKKRTIKKSLKKIIKQTTESEDSDDKWLCAETASEIFISAPPKPTTHPAQDKINKKLAEQFCINFDD